MTIGERIKETRKEKGMTQKQVGEKCGMPDSAVRKYESGSIIPKNTTLQRIADALDVSIGYLQGYESKDARVIAELSRNAQYRELERVLGLEDGSIAMWDGEKYTEETLPKDWVPYTGKIRITTDELQNKTISNEEMAKKLQGISEAAAVASQVSVEAIKRIGEELVKLSEPAQKSALIAIEGIIKAFTEQGGGPDE